MVLILFSLSRTLEVLSVLTCHCLIFLPHNCFYGHGVFFRRGVKIHALSKSVSWLRGATRAQVSIAMATSGKELAHLANFVSVLAAMLHLATNITWWQTLSTPTRSCLVVAVQAILFLFRPCFGRTIARFFFGKFVPACMAAAM